MREKLRLAIAFLIKFCYNNIVGLWGNEARIYERNERFFMKRLQRLENTVSVGAFSRAKLATGFKRFLTMQIK